MFWPVTLENASLRVQVYPQIGGKVASLVDKADGYELLFNFPDELPEKYHYDTPYNDHWFAGWDECFPSVAARVASGSGAWLFGAVDPTQPDQAVLAKTDVAVQAPAGVEGAAVADTCPVAPLQSAQRSDHERARPGADLTRNGV